MQFNDVWSDLLIELLTIEPVVPSILRINIIHKHTNIRIKYAYIVLLKQVPLTIHFTKKKDFHR